MKKWIRKLAWFLAYVQIAVALWCFVGVETYFKKELLSLAGWASIPILAALWFARKDPHPFDGICTKPKSLRR